MALSRIKKVFLLMLPLEQDNVLRRLQKLSNVQFVSAESQLTNQFIIKKNDTEFYFEETLKQTEEQLTRVRWIIDRLGKVKPKKSFIENLVTPKEFVSLDEFENIEQFSVDAIYKNVQNIEEAEHQIQKEIRKNSHLLKQINFLKGLNFNLTAFNNTRNTFVKIISIPIASSANIIKEVETLLGEESVIEKLNVSKSNLLLMVIAREEKSTAFLKWVENQQIQILQIADLNGTPDEISKELFEINVTLNKKLIDYDNELKKISSELSNILILEDYLSNKLERYHQMNNMLHSHFTKVMVGWIRESDINEFELALKDMQVNVGWFFEEPAADDNPPVDYDNPPLVKPFEFVTDLYSRPKYWELDPTPFLSAFFALYFGICLTDAGYGLIVTLGSFLALKKFSNQTANTKKLFKILFYSGIMTTIVGIFTGGFFGLSPSELPKPFTILSKLILLNPLENQMGFLLFALSLGVIHISLGIFLKFYWNIRHKQKSAAWFDQFPWLMIIAGVITLFAASQIQTIWLSKAGYVLLIVAAAIILIFSGRSSKNPFARFALGFYSLYQVSGLLGDVLSYARLFALGLATGVIAGVVNFLAKLTLGIPYLGYILMPIVLVAGHLLNIVINALGGFIHTARLQFVEFFGKFYEGGGEPFEPFELKLKYTKIKEQEKI